MKCQPDFYENIKSQDILWFVSQLNNKSICEKLLKSSFMVSDVDGSLTDAGVYVSADGEGGRNFSTIDGYVVQHAISSGLTIALVSGKYNLSTRIRGLRLGIPDELCIAGVKDKVNLINNLCEKYKLSFSQILVFGDDYLDTKIKKDIPEIIFACPLNAPFYFYHMADLVLPKPGGQHAFRLLVDLVLYVQKKHFAQDIISQALKVYKV